MLDSYEPVTKRSKTMDEDSIKMCHVAVAGCSHGELDGSIIYIYYGRFGFSCPLAELSFLKVMKNQPKRGGL